MYVNRAEDIPSGEHWAIIRTVGVFIPGDERSRTNPGHGYPERTENYLSYQAFTDEAEFRAEFTKKLNSPLRHNEVLRAIHVTGTYSGRTVVLEEDNGS